MHETSLYTTSVCTGSLLLGAAGLLKGLEATTHWSAYELLSSFGAHPVSSRVVHQVHMITSTASNSWFLRRNYVHHARYTWSLQQQRICDSCAEIIHATSHFSVFGKSFLDRIGVRFTFASECEGHFTLCTSGRDPWNCEGPWTSSEGHTVEIWNWFSSGHGPWGVE